MYILFCTQSMDRLKQKLLQNGVECTEKLFKTEDGISGISGHIFVSLGQHTIFIS